MASPSTHTLTLTSCLSAPPLTVFSSVLCTSSLLKQCLDLFSTRLLLLMILSSLCLFDAEFDDMRKRL